MLTFHPILKNILSVISMESGQEDIEQVPQRPTEEQGEHLAHTYKDDLAQAMNATEAPVVQAMLADARDREAFANQEIKEQGERKVYSLSSILFIVLTLAVIGYGTYYYMHLTVKVQQTQSVGAFPATSNIAVNSVTLQQLIASYASAQTTLPVGRPTLVNIVTGTGQALLSNSQLYSFIGAVVPEPLQSAVSVARLGMLNTGTTVLPFIIMSVPNPENASKEFAIAEPNLLQLFGSALNIDLASVQNNVGQTFESNYFYNLPVRTLNTVATLTTPSQRIFLYGYANNNTIVIATDPVVLKAVYDALINQH